MSEPSKAIQQYRPEDWNRSQPLPVVKAMGKMAMGEINDALPKFMKGQAEAVLRALYTECSKNTKLLEATPRSLIAAATSAAQMGLQLGGVLGQAYLVPFKGTVNLIIGYKGYIQLVNRSGQVGVLHAETVWEKDVFKVTKGSTPSLIHEPYIPQTVDEVWDEKTQTMKRKAVAFYATVMTKNGPIFETMSRIEAEIHRARFAMFKRPDAVWWKHFEAMAMKTCIIKLCKYLPMSAELQMAMSHDAADDGGDTGFDPSVMWSASNPVQIAGLAEEDEQEQEPVKPPTKVMKPAADVPDEEREPENLPAPTEAPNDRVERRVRGQAKKAGNGELFDGRSQMPPDAG